jgi:hypothetical protein
MDITFNSLEELYNHIKPALLAKKKELYRNGYQYIKEEDIWNYLKEIKWKKSVDLSLYEMVSDIFNADNTTIDTYLRSKLNQSDRKLYFIDK